MGKIKYRKCPLCESKMAVRKSHTKNTKFWGCTKFKDTGCGGSAEYYGGGARAGLNLDIREIDNGYIITTSPKYSENAEDDDPLEHHVTDLNGLSDALAKVFIFQSKDLKRRIEESTEFTDEIDPVKHEKRVKIANRGTTDVSELLAKMKEAKAKSSMGEKAVSLED